MTGDKGLTRTPGTRGIAALKRRKFMDSKPRTRPSWKKNTVRYKQQIAPAKTREGQENLQKKKRYASRHG